MRKAKVLGDLTSKEIAEGIWACLRNSMDLLETATALDFLNQRRKSVIYLIAALEEIAKMNLLLESSSRLIISDSASKKNFQRTMRKFKYHKPKQEFSAEIMHSDLVDEEKYKVLSNLAKKYQPIIEKARVDSLYVDFIPEKNKFVQPKYLMEENKDFLEMYEKLNSSMIDYLKSSRELLKNEENTERIINGFRKTMYGKWKSLGKKVVIKGEYLGVRELRRYVISQRRERKQSIEKSDIDFIVSLLISLYVAVRLSKKI
jgi:AbiV family abortive infection protein